MYERKIIHQGTINCGKVAAYGTRKINAAEIHFELFENDKHQIVFSACGTVWNSKHTDSVMGGQCLNNWVFKHIAARNSKAKAVIEMWKKYHLNDMHAGTPAQEAALADFEEKEKAPISDYYDWAVEKLRSINLYEDNGYKYGSSWLCEEIPQSAIEEIKSF
jgi:hypothetical protein